MHYWKNSLYAFHVVHYLAFYCILRETFEGITMQQTEELKITSPYLSSIKFATLKGYDESHNPFLWLK